MFVKRLGLPWLIGLVVIPLLIAAIGYGALRTTRGCARADRGVANTDTIDQVWCSEVFFGAVFNDPQRQRNYAQRGFPR